MLNPIINSKNLTTEARAFAELIVGSRGANKGRVLFARPSKGGNEAHYVWRMVAFQISVDAKAHCLPISAAFSLIDTYQPHDNACGRGGNDYAGMFDGNGSYRFPCSCGADERTAALKIQLDAQRERLDRIVEEICSTVSANEHYGVRKWARALTGVDPVGSSGLNDWRDVTSPINHNVLTLVDEMEGALL